jgi:hypothetical protein
MTDWSKIPQGTPVRCIDDEKRDSMIVIKVKQGSRYTLYNIMDKDHLEVYEIIGGWRKDRFVPIIDYGEPEDEQSENE